VKGGLIERRMKQSNNGYDDKVAVTVQENNYCDEDIMLIWVQECLKPFLVSQGKSLSLFMMDNFSAHLPKSVRQAISECGALQVMLPPNMTSRVQILDVGINKPFKNRVGGKLILLFRSL
jgi:hypothetical protein